jgi:hypothetical protein
MSQPVSLPSSFPLEDFSFEFAPGSKIILYNNKIPSAGPFEYNLVAQGPVRIHTDGQSIFLGPTNGANSEVTIDLGNPRAEVTFFKRTGIRDLELIGADDLSYEIVSNDPPVNSGPPIREVHRFSLSVCPVELHAVSVDEKYRILMKYSGNGSSTPGYTRLTHIHR